MKDKQRASKEDAAAGFAELAEAQTKEEEDDNSAGIVTACATADYRQGRIRVLEGFLRLLKAKEDTTKTVERTEANVTPEEHAKWMRIFSAGGPSGGASGGPSDDTGSTELGHLKSDTCFTFDSSACRESVGDHPYTD